MNSHIYFNLFSINKWFNLKRAGSLTVTIQINFNKWHELMNVLKNVLNSFDIFFTLGLLFYLFVLYLRLFLSESLSNVQSTTRNICWVSVSFIWKFGMIIKSVMFYVCDVCLPSVWCMTAGNYCHINLSYLIGILNQVFRYIGTINN